MFKIYPVTETTPPPAEYAVKINGQPVPLNFARVSKEPYNRRCPAISANWTRAKKPHSSPSPQTSR